MCPAGPAVGGGQIAGAGMAAAMDKHDGQAPGPGRTEPVDIDRMGIATRIEALPLQRARKRLPPCGTSLVHRLLPARQGRAICCREC